MDGPNFDLITAGEAQVAELKDWTIATERDATDVVGNASYLGADYVIVKAAQLAPEFFDLSSGLAGEVLQKFANNRVGLAGACVSASVMKDLEEHLDLMLVAK